MKNKEEKKRRQVEKQREKSRKQQEKKKIREERKIRFQKNREIYVIAGLLSLFFLAMTIYYAYYVIAVSDSVVNNSYNPRIASMENTVNRGSILSSSGQVLAETIKTENGDRVRNYPYGELFAHPIGYSTMKTTELERYLNFTLLSSHESILKKVYYDLTEQRYEGDSVYTTLDAGLQQAVWDAMGSYNGAAIVMEPSTGRILAMVSKPGYNPNTLAEDWSSLISEENKSYNLMNRVSQGIYPPGSTFKLLTVLEYIRENPDTWQDVTFECDGAFEYGDGLVLHCHDGEAHGTVDIRSGVAVSCNGINSWLGLSLDRERFLELCQSFGFNDTISLEIGTNASQITLDETLNDWAMMLTSIGQGTVMETPLQNALITCAIANDGIMMKPYLVETVVNEQWQVVQEYKPQEYRDPLTKEEADFLTDCMIAVVNEGSGGASGSTHFQIAGKTGSADYDSNGNRHAWYTGFAPAEDPQIVVSVILENGQSGGTYAAPVAKAIFEYYLLRE